MPELIEASKVGFFPWGKGAALWGEPLPHAHQDGDREMILLGDWWNRTRVPLLLEWQCAAAKALLIAFGDDRYQKLRAVARCHGDRMERLQAEAGTEKLNFRALFESWVPTAEERAKIEELVEGYARRREALRSWLLEARDRHAELAEDLPEDREAWTPMRMAGAMMRLPKLLLVLVRTGEVPDPGTLVPEKALVNG